MLDLLKGLAREYRRVGRLSRDILNRFSQADLEAELKKIDQLIEARAAALNKAESYLSKIEERGGWGLLLQGRLAAGSTPAEALIVAVRQAAQEAKHLGGELNRKVEQRQAELRTDILRTSRGGRLMKGYQGFGVRLPSCLDRQA